MGECSADALTRWAVEAISQKLKEVERPLIIALSGAQGSGKSTQSARWAQELQERGHPGLVLSLDDFYLPKENRLSLAASVHPLSATRGPPGTHDTQRLISVLETIAERSVASLELPVFSKADDDRVTDQVHKIGSLDWVIVEGWCMGISRARINAQELQCLIFQEAKAEAWRAWVQASIDRDWSRLDALCDWSIYLRISEFESIVDARWRQEEALKRTSGRSQFKSRDEVRAFVSLYEPWTLRMACSQELWADHTFDVAPGYTYREVKYPQSG